METDKLLTIKEVADMLSLTEYTVTQRIIKPKKLTVVKLSDKTFRVKESDFERYIEERTTAQAV